MNITPTLTELNPEIATAALHSIDQMATTFWQENHDLFEIVKAKKSTDKLTAPIPPEIKKPNSQSLSNSTILVEHQYGLLTVPLRGKPLRAACYESYCIRRQHVLENQCAIVPRTAANNRKSEYKTIEEETADQKKLVQAYIRNLKSSLPTLLSRFAKLPDYRNENRIKHKVTVIMLFGLLAFVFKIASKRKMTKKLTRPLIVETLKTIFPELETIPHADTLMRFLEHLDPTRIEAILVQFIRELIRKKKFKKMLIAGRIPISIDGSQKLYRDGLLQDDEWLERTVGKDESKHQQQYIYVLEANITLAIGLSIPLMSEFLKRDSNQFENSEDKQDCELKAFKRLVERMKGYFPRAKFLLFLDALFAAEEIMLLIKEKRWDFIIRLPMKKMTTLAKILNAEKPEIDLKTAPHYRERQQVFFWKNNVTYGYEHQIKCHLVGCIETYEEVNRNTGELEQRYSQHAWISSLHLADKTVHELLNLGARKLWLMEHSFNVEKNQGYHYEHAFSHEWFAMRGFHYLMRLGHALNAVFEFTRVLKKYIKAWGVQETFDRIIETLCSPWLPLTWYKKQIDIAPHLQLQLTLE